MTSRSDTDAEIAPFERRSRSDARQVNLDNRFTGVARDADVPSELSNDIVAGDKTEAPTFANGCFASERIARCHI
jgi:hypothetical protein